MKIVPYYIPATGMTVVDFTRLRENLKLLNAEYLCFLAEGEKYHKRYFRKLLKAVDSQADIVMEAVSAYPEKQWKTVPMDIVKFCDRFTFVPCFNGKLIRVDFLLEILNREDFNKWTAFSMPELLVFCLFPLKLAGVETEQPVAAKDLRRISACVNEAELWIKNSGYPSTEQDRALTALFCCEERMVNAAVRKNYENSELFSLFNRSVVVWNFHRHHQERLQDLFLTKQKEKRVGKVRKIGVFCWALRGGGAEQCASLMLQKWSEIRPDIQFYLFVFKPWQKGDYNCPENVKQIVLPFEALSRIIMEERILKEEEIDTCIYYDHLLEQTYLDILTADSLGIRTVPMEHSTFSLPYYNGYPELVSLRHAVYGVADYMTCLSNSDEFIWTETGINTRYMPNPLTFEPRGIESRQLENKTMIFIGRMIPEKGVEAAVRLTALLKKKHPDVKLLMLGAFLPESDYKDYIAQLVQSLGVEKQIEFVGFTSNVSDYLQKASVHIMPTMVEGYSMTLMEAKAYGLPTVAFAMPYLEAAKEQFGTIQVPKQDIDAMAEAVSGLFDDFTRMNEMGRLAKNTLALFSNEMVYARWNDLFESLEYGEDRGAMRKVLPDTEQRLEYLRIQYQELLYSVQYLPRNTLYREKFTNDELKTQRRNNLLLDVVFQVYFLLVKLDQKESAKFIVKAFIFCIQFMKRIYRRFVPWTGEEQKL